MIIPYDQLDAAVLNNLIEAFIGREGTDYGEYEVDLETKINQVKAQLKAGTAVITFDLDTQTPNILPAVEAKEGHV